MIKTPIIISFLSSILFSSVIILLSSDLTLLIQAVDPICPEVLKNIPCERIKCSHNVTNDDCPLDTFFIKNLTMCGCCPGCAKYIGLPNPLGPDPKIENLLCTKNSTSLYKNWIPDCSGPSCPIRFNQCSPGLECNGETGLCSLPIKTMNCQEECLYKKTLNRLGLYHWDPDCDTDGSYRPKQCKGESGGTGICFCVDPCGQRIFGTEWRSKAENQTCACSRQVKTLQNTGNIITLHCSPDGNYEPLQCDTDSALCYCVNEQTGKLTGGLVPQTRWNSLPCFTPNVTNFEKDGRYLRKCESNYGASQIILKAGEAHNTKVTLRPPTCDYDGSYAPKQTRGTRTECVYKNGTTIKDFFKINSDIEMDCNCARDEFLYKTSGRPFGFACAGQTGNYKSNYNFGTVSSCVDRDGIMYGNVTPSKYACCLDKSCTKDGCYDEILNPNGYRACCKWPFEGGVCPN